MDRTVRVPAEELTLSELGLAILEKWEGIRTMSYRDVGGVPTIGIGSTYYPRGTTYIHNGVKQFTSTFSTPVRMGDTITIEEARRISKMEAENTFGRGIAKSIMVPINQNEYDSYTSLAYNIGLGNFRSSTLLRLLNQKKYDEAAEQILVWNKVNKRVVQGLVNRRNDEYNLNKGVYNG